MGNFINTSIENFKTLYTIPETRLQLMVILEIAVVMFIIFVVFVAVKIHRRFFHRKRGEE